MSSLSLALEILGRDLSGGAFASVLARLGAIEAAAAGAGAGASDGLGGIGTALQQIEGAAIGAGVAFIAFAGATKMAVDAGAQLQQASVMASIAISDGSKHVGELEDAIVNLANTSQYKIADVDMAFRVLGGLGFTTSQIINDLGKAAITLAQAMGGPGAGVSAADAAQLLGQAIYLFGSKGLTAAHAADVLTGAFYNNMMSVESLTQFMGMAGGTAVSLGVSFDQLMTFGSMLTPMFGSASSAGASLAYMMRNLAHPATDKMAAMIKHLGLQVYDAQGNFVGLKSIMDQLFTDTQGMTEKQKMDIFGTLFNVRSGRAAMDLMSQTKDQFDAAYTRINSRLTQVGQAQRDSNAINDTGIGTWQRLATTVNDFFAKAGMGIVKALIPLGDHLNNLFSTLQKSPIANQFFAAFLVGGTILAGLTLVVVAIVGAFMLFGTVVGVAIAVLGGIAAAAAFGAGLFTMFSTKVNFFSGALSFLNPIVDAFRYAWGLVVTTWETGVLPLLNYAAPLFKVIGIIILGFVGILIGVLIVAFLAVAAVITFVIGVIAALAAGIVFVVSHAQGWWNQFYQAIYTHVQLAAAAITIWWHNVQQFFSSLPGKLRQWGADLIQNFIDGILSKIGAVGDAVGQIGNIISNLLHHSKPKEGPLADDDEWGGHLVENFATGMVNKLPTLVGATRQVAGTVAGGLSGVTPSGSYAPSGFSSAVGQQVVIPIYIGEDVIAEYGYNTMTGQLTMNGMNRQYR